MKGARGANGGTRATMRTSALDAFDFLSGVLNQYALIFEIFDAIPEFLPRSRQFKNHHTFLTGQYGGVQYIKGKIIVLDKVTNDRFLYHLLRKAKNEYFRVHDKPPENFLFLTTKLEPELSDFLRRDALRS
jgi:hypothetical protein